MNDKDIKVFEQYIFSGYSEKFINELPLTNMYEIYLKAIYLINTKWSNLSISDNHFLKMAENIGRDEYYEEIIKFSYDQGNIMENNLENENTIYNEFPKINDTKEPILRELSNSLRFRHLVKKIDSSQNKEELNNLFDQLIDDFTYRKNFYQEEEGFNVKDQTKPCYILEENFIENALDAMKKEININGWGINSYSKSILSQMDYTKFNGDEFIKYILLMKSDICFVNQTELINIFIKHYQEASIKNEVAPFKPEIYFYLPIDFLDKLQESLPKIINDVNFVNSKFKKKFWFELSPRQVEAFSDVERMETLILMYEQSTQYPLLKEFSTKLLSGILQIGMKINKINSKWFLLYLESNFKASQIKSNSKGNNTNLESLLAPYFSNLKESSNDMDFIKYYLERLFFNGSRIEDFNKYIDKNLLVKIYEEANFLMGKSMGIIDKESSQKFIDLAQKPSINILSISDDPENGVEIVSEIKNISELTANVFFINEENFFIINHAAFDSNIDLDGLVPSEKVIFHYKFPGQVLHIESLKFPQLNNVKGRIIIELTSNGIFSRATLKRGMLFVVSSKNSLGQSCYIIDETKKVCSGNNTYLRIDDCIYKPDLKTDGVIQIPFSSAHQITKAVLRHDDLTEIVDFERCEEEYHLEFDYMIPPDSIIEGKRIKIVIRPTVYCCGIIASSEIIEKPLIKITSTELIEGKSVIQEIIPECIMNNKEVEFEFNVIENLNFFEITFECNVKVVSKNKLEKFTLTKRISSESFKQYENTAFFHLRKINENYEILAIGKNGEPIKGVDITLNFLIFGNKNTPKLTELKTNEQGIILLGKLDNVRSLSAEIRNSPSKENISKKNWNICNKISFIDHDYDIIENSNFELILPKEFASSLWLKKISNKMVLANYTHKIKVQYLGDNVTKVILENLDRGHFKLKSAESKFKSIKIHVYQGTYWKDRYIITKNQITERRGTNITNIQNVAYKKEKGKSYLKIDLINPIKSTRVHVMGFHFIPSAFHTKLENLNSSFIESLHPKVTEFPKNLPRFSSNYELGSELSYILERKKQKYMTHPEFEKPSLILKRNPIKVTKVDDEIITEKERPYLDESESTKIQKKDEKPKPAIDGKKKSNFQKSKEKNIEEQKVYISEDRAKSEMPEKPKPKYAYSNTEMIFETNNFLDSVEKALYNLVPDCSNSLYIDEEFTDFPMILIIACDQRGISYQVFPNTQYKGIIKMKDIRMKSNLKNKFDMIEKFESNNYYKGDKIKIDNNSITEFGIIDSLENALSVVSNCISTLNDNFKKYRALCHWEEFSQEQKLKYVSKKWSHELNFFIKKKDRAFFDTVILPHLKCKCEKSLMDHILMENLKAIQKHMRIRKFCDWNFMEKALICELMYKNKNPDFDKIFTHMKYKLEAHLRDNPKEKIIYIGDIINFAKINTKGSDLEHLFNQEKEFEEEKSENEMEFMDEEQMCFLKDMEEVGCETAEAGEEEEDEDKGEDFDAKNYRKRRKKLLMLRNQQIGNFTELGCTFEFCETHYSCQENYYREALSRPSQFWMDYANHIKSESASPFLSSNFILSTLSCQEALIILGVLDLPFLSQNHGFISKNNETEIKAADNLIMLTKTLSQREESIIPQLLINKRIVQGIRNKDTTEFQVNISYKCFVYITNLSNNTYDIALSCKIPEGSIPLELNSYNIFKTIKIKEYETKNEFFSFYFPLIGDYKLSPFMLIFDNKIVAKTQVEILNVKEKQNIKSNEPTLDTLARQNDKEGILKYLENHNTFLNENIDFYNQDSFLANKEFFDKSIKILEDRKQWKYLFWMYSGCHRDMNIFGEIFDFFVAKQERIGYYFKSKHININKNNWTIRILEFAPYVCPRAHDLITKRSHFILNYEFRQTYFKLLRYLVEKNRMGNKDALSVCLYLILQNRIKEARKIFMQIKPLKDKFKYTLQYDYLSIYFDFYFGGPKFEVSKSLCEKYKNYPIVDWNRLFKEAKEQIEEYEGKMKDILIIDQDIENMDIKRIKEVKISSSKSMFVKVQDSNLIIEHENLDKVIIRYFKIHLETLFSRNPFFTQTLKNIAFVKPYIECEEKLKKSENISKIGIHKNLLKDNLIIEISSDHISQFINYFPTTFKVNVIEKYGIIKIQNEASQKLAKIYIKVYAKNVNEKVSFFKDGYTDFRGVFNYSTLNNKKIEEIKKFAILISNENEESMVIECDPPKY